jgi:alkylation response protein AidB-like acyl-CoA dehydrogenase
VVARSAGSVGEQGIGLYAVDGQARGLTRRPLTTIDTTRRQAELSFAHTPARQLGHGDAALKALRNTLDRATIALACEMAGGARALLNSAVEYAKLRMQFGRPIGSFQAVKHKCAEMLLEVELAASAARYAAAAVDEQDPEVPALASLAKAMAGDAYMHAAVECIQIHGGIGFTWDHDTHLWFKRAKSSEVLLGDASHHRERYLALTEAAR